MSTLPSLERIAPDRNGGAFEGRQPSEGRDIVIVDTPGTLTRSSDDAPFGVEVAMKSQTALIPLAHVALVALAVLLGIAVGGW